MKRRARSTRSFWGALGAVCVLACAGEAPEADAEAGTAAPPPATQTVAWGQAARSGPHPVVRLELGTLGTLEIELYPALAPKTVENFKTLVEKGFYERTQFHRVIPGFMIQGGDPLSRKPDPRHYGRGNPGYRIEDEFSDYPHLRGTVSMANRGRPDTAGSQFFIVHEDSRHLDGDYTAFGRVIRGMDVVDAITELELDVFGRFGPPDRPHPVHATITKATWREPGSAPEQQAEAEPRPSRLAAAAQPERRPGPPPAAAAPPEAPEAP